MNDADLRAALAADRDPLASRYRRLGVTLAGLAVAVGLAWGAIALTGRPRSPAHTEPADEIDTSQYLRPIETAPAGPGERVAPFSGFALSVETDPPGALVVIAGVPRGEAPVMTNLACKAGEAIEVRAEKAGFPRAVTSTRCREDALVKLTVALRR